MPINKLRDGDATPIGFALGDTTITKMYLGDVLIYDGMTNIDLKKDIVNPTDITYELIDDLLD